MSARRRSHLDDQPHTDGWAVPYGDLVTLLLAFFVVMYATSTANEGKYRVLSDALNAAFAGAPRTTEPIPLGQPLNAGRHRLEAPAAFDVPTFAQAGPSPARIAKHGEGVTTLDRVEESLVHDLRRRIFAEQVYISRSGKGLEVELDADLLFASGAAEISSEARSLVRHIAGILTPYPNRVVVEGHTDNEPIHTFRFPSNWELSAARAVSVLRVLTDAGVAATRLSVQGYGEFQPIERNDTARGRLRNRRVVLVIRDEQWAPDRRPDATDMATSMARGTAPRTDSTADARGPNPAPERRPTSEGA